MTLLPGEQTDAEVKFPEDHPDESRRGQSRRVRVDASRREAPGPATVSTMRFAREVGDFENLDAVPRGDPPGPRTRGDARGRRPGRSGAGPSRSSRPTTSRRPETGAPLMHAYAEMYRVPPEQLQQFEQQFHQVAEAQVRRDLVLDAVVEANASGRPKRSSTRSASRPGRACPPPALRQPPEGQPPARARINPGTIGGAQIQNVSPDVVDRIEIVKGPRSTLYGTDAIGGVINIITRRYPTSGFDASVGYGRYDTREAAFSGGFRGDNSETGSLVCGSIPTGFRRNR